MDVLVVLERGQIKLARELLTMSADTRNAPTARAPPEAAPGLAAA